MENASEQSTDFCEHCGQPVAEVTEPLESEAPDSVAVRKRRCTRFARRVAESSTSPI